VRRPAGEGIAAACAALLIVCLKALKWYGYAGSSEAIAPGRAGAAAVTGWRALTTLRWLAVAVCAFTLVALLARIALRDRYPAREISVLTIAAGGVTTLLLLYRVVVSLPGAGSFADQKLGALLGVIAAAGIVYGGLEGRHGG
jgi:hypothetical protein